MRRRCQYFEYSNGIYSCDLAAVVIAETATRSHKDEIKDDSVDMKC